MVVEVVTGVLVSLLAIASVVAGAVGILCLMGAARLTRCQACGHLGLAAAHGPLRSCLQCRHERLFHPVLAHHAGRHTS
jgi:hypothetical protein